jgi:ParB/Sulfiredoxin domain
MAGVQRIRIADIVVSVDRQRALQAVAIQNLADSIREIGLRSPITVRMIDGKPHLVTGEHRMKAMLSLDHVEIEAFVFDDEHRARVWAIDENLQRADLTAIERSEHIAARAALIEARVAAERTAAPSPDQRFATREEAKAAKVTFFYPAERCANGHEPKRYVSNGDCHECHKAKVARWKEAKGYKPSKDLTVYTPGGRGNMGGSRAAGRALGVSHEHVRTAKIFDKLPDKVKQEAIRLDLANKHHVLRYVAAHDTVALQMKALASQAQRQAEKAERKRRDAMTVQEQAAMEAAESKAIPLIDDRREAAANYWLWLVEEVGDRAYTIVNRMREVDIRLLIEEADRAKEEERIVPKPRLH